jgi:16S rRNA processing protein RimM
MTKDTKSRLICVGMITSAHGIRGAVNIKSYTENPKDIASYGPVFNKEGERSYKLKVISVKKDNCIIAMIDGTDTRNDAEKLKGMKLYIPRGVLPEILEDDEFYSEDLLGLTAFFQDGKEYGVVQAVHNYGSCDILEIRLKDSNKEELLAFTKEIVPEINLEEGYIIVDLPEVEFVGDNDNAMPKEDEI